MTVAVSCNLSDGVVLAVDSAVTLPDASGGIVKIYENAEKLFQLGDRPIGVAAYGLGALGNRSIGSYLNEFETRDPNDVVSGQNTLADVVEGLRDFFMTAYMTAIVPELENQLEKTFDEIPLEQRPALGLVVGGFSHDEFLSEVWHIVVPLHEAKGSAEQARPQGSFGTNWFAMFEPIRRYIKGFDPALMDEVVTYFVNKRGSPLNPTEQQELTEMLDRHEYPIPFGAMPIEEGIEHARFLAEMVVNHHRFVVGAPVVGGRINAGSVTYRRGRFRILGPRS